MSTLTIMTIITISESKLYHLFPIIFPIQVITLIIPIIYPIISTRTIIFPINFPIIFLLDQLFAYYFRLFQGESAQLTGAARLHTHPRHGPMLVVYFITQVSKRVYFITRVSKRVN